MQSVSRSVREVDFAVTILAVGIVVAFFTPSLAAVLAPVALPALFLVIVFSLVPFADADRTELTQIDDTVWRMVIWQQFALPGLVIAGGTLLRLPDHVISLMIVTACSGSLFASPALAGLLNLDKRSALQCMVLSTLAMPASLFFFLSAFHGVNVHLEISQYLLRAAVFLLIPLGMFAVYRNLARSLSPRASRTVERIGHWGAIIALLVFGIGIMHAAAEQFVTEPLKIAFYLLIVTCLSVMMLLVTVIVMYRFGYRKALTAGMLNSFRNVGLGFALVGEMIGSELAPYVGASMLPIFLAPAVIRLTMSTRATFDDGEDADEAVVMAEEADTMPSVAN